MCPRILTRNNEIYAWTGHYNIDRPYTVNGLNQLTTAGATALVYDGRGNLTSSGTNGYGYTSENRLVNGPAGAVLVYDALGRLATTALSGGSVNQQTFDNIGGNIVIERGSGGTGLLRRYVYGPGVDTPLTWYEGNGTTDRRWLHADERGSIVAVTDANGTTIAVNSYDEYGIPASTNVGRFQYTGQAWLPELGMYYYKARIYSATLGRFMQTDPIGYGDGMNMYGYVGGDPVNKTDPSGMYTDADGTIVIAGYDKAPVFGPVNNLYNSQPMGGTGPFSPGITYDYGRIPKLTFDLAAVAEATKATPQKSLFCRAVGLLGDNFRLRVGADAAGGLAGFLRGGLGLSLRGDASIEFDDYLGGGVGAGLLYGAGVGLDNAGGTARGANPSVSREITAGIGIGAGGAGVTIPNEGSIGRTSINTGGTQTSGGLSVGPKFGFAAGNTKSGNFTARSPGLCQ